MSKHCFSLIVFLFTQLWCLHPLLSFGQRFSSAADSIAVGEHHYEMASKYIQQRKIKKSVAHLDTLIMMNYEVEFAYIYRAQMNTNYATNFDEPAYFERAILDYEICELWYADAGSYWFNRAMCEKAFGVRLSNNEDDFDKARLLLKDAKNHFKKAMSVEPEYRKSNSVTAQIAHVDDALKRLGK